MPVRYERLRDLEVNVLTNESYDDFYRVKNFMSEDVKYISNPLEDIYVELNGVEGRHINEKPVTCAGLKRMAKPLALIVFTVFLFIMALLIAMKLVPNKDKNLNPFTPVLFGLIPLLAFCIWLAYLLSSLAVSGFNG